MAEAVDFPERNDWIGKPENQSNHQCYALPVCRMVSYMSGIIPGAPMAPVLTAVSFWKFTDEEIEQILITRGVYVRHQGTTISPMNIFSHFPTFNYTDEQGRQYHEFIPTKEDLDYLRNYGKTPNK